MSPSIRVSLQVLASLLLVAAVLWFMWRLPRKSESLFGWAPPLALGSAWAGLLSLIVSALLWWLPSPDVWIVILFLALDPAAVAGGVLVHWIYRGHDDDQTIANQRLQASVGVVLGLLAVAVGYTYVMTHKTIFTPTGM